MIWMGRPFVLLTTVRSSAGALAFAAGSGFALRGGGGGTELTTLTLSEPTVLGVKRTECVDLVLKSVGVTSLAAELLPELLPESDSDGDEMMVVACVVDDRSEDSSETADSVSWSASGKGRSRRSCLSGIRLSGL